MQDQANTTVEKETTTAVALSSHKVTKQDLELFVADYKNLVVTPETYEASKKARQAIRAKRFDIQGIEKSNNDQLNALKKQNKSNAEELIAVLTEVENKIHSGIEQIEAQKEKEKQDKLAAIEQKFNNRLAELLKTQCEFDGATYRLGNVSIGFGALRSLSDLDFCEVMESFNNELAAIEQNANRYILMMEAGMKGDKAEFTYPKDLFPNSGTIVYVSAINACTNDEFEKLLGSIKAEVATAQQRVDEDKRAAAELKKRTENRITELANTGCIYTGVGYNYGQDQKLSQSEVQTMDPALWLIRFAQISEEIAGAKANEAKQREEAVRLAEENKALLEARTKSRAALLFGLDLSLSGDEYCFHNIEVSAKQVEQLLEAEWIEVLGIVTQKVADKKKQIDAALAAEKTAVENKAKEDAARLEALKPEKEKLTTYLCSLQQVSRPELATAEAQILLDEVTGCINKYSEKIIALK